MSAMQCRLYSYGVIRKSYRGIEKVIEDSVVESVQDIHIIVRDAFQNQEGPMGP